MSILHSQDVHLIDYLRVLYKRRIFFVVVILVALAGTFWSTWRQTRIYSSTSRVLLETEATLVDFPGVENRSFVRLDTEMHIMRSREVAEHAVRSRLRPGLDRREPEFESLVNRLIGSTGVDGVRNTLIVEMRVMADDPEKARSWCEAMAESYVESNFEARKQANNAAARAIREEIATTLRDLEAAERRLLDFKVENNLVSDVTKREIQSRSFGAGTAAQVEASLKKLEYEKKHQVLLRWYQSSDFSVPLPPDVAGTALVGDLYEQIVKKRTEYKTLLSTYREQHPKVQAVKGEIEALRRSFDQEVQAALVMLRKSAELYSTIGQAHSGRIETEKTEFLRENERDWQYNVLQRDVDVKSEIYKALLQKLGEINITTSLVKNNVRIIERPKAVPIPIRPNWRFNLLVGLVFGMGVAVAGVFFLEYLDKTMKTPDDVARYLGLPVLAVVPLARNELLRSPYATPRLRDSDADAAPAA